MAKTHIPAARAQRVAVIDHGPGAHLVATMLVRAGLGPVVVLRRMSEIRAALVAERFSAILVRPEAFGPAGQELFPLLERLRGRSPVEVIDRDAPLSQGDVHAGALSTLLARVRDHIRRPAEAQSSTADHIDRRFIAVDPLTVALVARGYALAPCARSLTITGEIGSGKETFARELHRGGSSPGRFVVVDVSGVDADSLHVALFGKDGNHGDAPPLAGAVLAASAGTVYLDGIDGLAAEAVPALVRLIAQAAYVPVGGTRMRRSSARVVCATNWSLERMRDADRLDPALLQLLGERHLYVPALRERPGDLALLWQTFVAEAGGSCAHLDDDALAELTGRALPGNLRALQAVVAVVVGRGLAKVTARDIDATIAGLANALFEHPEGLRFPRRLPTLRELQRLLVVESLRRSGGNQATAAIMLGITRQALNQRIGRAALGRRGA